jgi:putative oxidoreductase
MKLGLALARLLIGGLFVGHGTQKLFGWFGGGGRAGTGQFFESIGLKPGERNAMAAGASETAGGALIAAGLLTPLGASLISGPMITAIRTVHLPNGPWVANSGWEYNAVLVAVMFALTDIGPGDWSLDAAAGRDLSGPVWAILELAAAGAGSYAVTKAAQGIISPAGDSAPAGDPATAGASPS